MKVKPIIKDNTLSLTTEDITRITKALKKHSWGCMIGLATKHDTTKSYLSTILKRGTSKIECEGGKKVKAYLILVDLITIANGFLA